MTRPRTFQRFATSRMAAAAAPQNAKIIAGMPILSTKPKLSVAKSTVADLSAPATADAEARPQSIPHMFRALAEKYPDHACIRDPHHWQGQSEYTFSELYEEMRSFAAGLSSLGVKAGNTVGQFCESSARWLVADQGVMLTGTCNAVRGASTNTKELAYIMQHSECMGLILQDAELLGKLIPHFRSLTHRVRFVVVLWGDVAPSASQQARATVITYDDLIDSGKRSIAAQKWSEGACRLATDSLATLVYTSGTSGEPKAAALSHSNILYQVEQFPNFVAVSPGQSALSLLPLWHVYERAVQYYLLSRAACIIYSNVAHFKRDLAAHKPSFLSCVPLLLARLHARTMASLAKLPAFKRACAQLLVALSVAHTRAKRVLRGVACQFSLARPSLRAYVAALCTFLFTAFGHQLAKALVYSKVRKELGVREALICGGGSLAPHLDDFFEAMELPVLNGWGLTETSPVLACRALETEGQPQRNTRGTVGLPIPGTHVKVVDPDDLGREVPDGSTGVLLAKGPGVMSGYWQNPAATEAAFVDGYFNTGDLGRRVPAGNLMSGQIILTGRCKDTITLLDGENVAPQPIEDALCRSALLTHVMLVGQDKRTLGALVCLSTDELKLRMEAGGDERGVGELSDAELGSVALAEITKLNRQRLEAERYEVITAATALKEPFSVENGTLTQTLKLRRSVVRQVYEREVAALLERLR